MILTRIAVSLARMHTQKTKKKLTEISNGLTFTQVLFCSVGHHEYHDDDSLTAAAAAPGLLMMLRHYCCCCCDYC